MAMLSIWRVLLGMVLITMGACSSRPKKAVPFEHQEVLSAPPQSATPNAPEAVAADVPPPIKTKKVTLILGPGMARSLAHIGVLKAFREQKVELCGIYAAEFSAWIAGLYGVYPSPNRFEWEALRIRGDAVIGRRSGISAWFDSSADTSKLEQQLAAQFDSKRLESSSVPVLIGFMNLQSGTVEWRERGEVKELVRASVSVQPLFSPVLIDGVRSAAVNGSQYFPTDQDRDGRFASADCVPLWVGVHSPANAAEEKDKTLETYAHTMVKVVEPSNIDSIHPDLKEFGFFDWAKRNAIIYRGKVAAMNWIKTFKNR